MTLIAAKVFVFFLFGFAVDAQTRHRPGLETGNADVVAAVFTNPVGAIVNAGKGCLDLADQAALTVTDAQGKGPVGFCSGAVSRVGKHFVAIRQFFQGAVTLLLRKQQTRQKIVLGGALVAMAEAGDPEAQRLRDRIMASLTRDADRKAFGL